MTDRSDDTPPFSLHDWVQNAGLRALIATALALPYRWRVPLAGWAVSHIVAPVAGFRRRIRRNLARVLPDLPEPEVARLTRAVPDNAGRTLIEVYSGAEFKARVAPTLITGDGLAAIEAAHAAGQGVILVSGHFGNYDVARAVLSSRGMRVGALYRPFNNRYFDAHYRRAIAAIGAPIFPRERRGLAQMVRFLREGGMIGMLIDQAMRHGEELSFFGEPAMTATSAAEMALKYDLLLVPVYGVRQPDGLSFELVIEPPIPRGTPEDMTQAANDSLERQVRAHPAQWLWIHRRWKLPKRWRE